MKSCSSCGFVKDFADFHNDKSKKDGRTSKCKPCAKTAARKWEIDNPEKKRARAAVWRSKSKEKIAIYSQRYTLKQSREDLREKLNAWRRANPEANRAALSRRRKLLNTENSYTSDDLKEIYSKQNGCCAVCKIAVGQKYHADHVIPVSKGGDNSRQNIQVLCAKCNLHKNAKDPITFMQSQGYLL